MKQTSNPQLNKQKVVQKKIDRPCIDFAFKSIRSLNQLMDNMPSMKNSMKGSQIKDPAKTATVIGISMGNPTKKSSQGSKQSQSNPTSNPNPNNMQPQLQIVRTIETTDHNYMQTQQKKAVNQKQKIEKKNKKVIVPEINSLFLGYNKISSIDNFIEFVEPIFPNLIDNLMWVDLCHNRLVELSPDLGHLKNLKTLYLHVNYISNFAELQKVKNAEQLRTLTIHANPLESYQQFRIIVHSIFPGLKKLDSTLLTKRETERAEVLMKSMKKYPVIKNAMKPPTESDNDEEQDN